MIKCNILKINLVLLCSFWGSSIAAQVYTLNASTNGTSVSTCFGAFFDSGGAFGNYGNNEDYVMTFCSATPGQYMRLTFTSFTLESNFDFLQIYDGNSVISPLIGSYSGSSPGTITASGSCLTVRFVSNGGAVQSGWSAGLTCVGTPGSNPTCSGFKALVVNYGSSTLTQYDGVTGTYLGTLATSTQGLSAPNFVYQLPNGSVLIPNGSAGNVVRLNPFTGQLLGTFATGLSFPEQIKLGPDGNLYLANQSANNLKKYDFNGTLLATITNANFSNPQGIGFDVGGNMFVSNNVSGGQINKYTTAGAFISTLKTYPAGETPRGIAMLGNDLYINIRTSTGARVEKFTNATGVPTTFLTMDAGSNPYAGIVWGPDGRLYIADYGESEVQIYNADGSVYRTITSTLNGCHGVAFAGCTPLDIRPPLVVSTLCNASTGSITSDVVGGIQPYTYAWSTGATTPSITGLAGGTYYLTVTDWNKVVVVDTVVVNCICPTMSNPSPAQNICVGGSGSNISTQISTNATSVRFVRFTSDKMAGATPTTAEAAAIYAGTQIGSIVTPSGASNPFTATYTYNPADFPNAGSTPINYFVYAIISPDAGVGCRPTQEINITIQPIVSISTQPTGFTECIGGTQTLTAAAVGGFAPLTYQWQNGGATGASWSDISGATSPSYTPLSTSAGTTLYRVIVSSASGTVCNPATSNNAQVTVVNDPSVSITIPPAIVCVGANVTLTASPTVATGSCSLQWQSSPDGTTWTNISGATGNTYNVTSLGATTRYRAQLISCTGNGCCN